MRISFKLYDNLYSSNVSFLFIRYDDTGISEVYLLATSESDFTTDELTFN